MVRVLFKVPRLVRPKRRSVTVRSWSSPIEQGRRSAVSSVATGWGRGVTSRLRLCRQCAYRPSTRASSSTAQPEEYRVRDSAGVPVRERRRNGTRPLRLRRPTPLPPHTRCVSRCPAPLPQLSAPPGRTARRKRTQSAGRRLLGPGGPASAANGGEEPRHGFSDLGSVMTDLRVAAEVGEALGGVAGGAEQGLGGNNSAAGSGHEGLPARGRTVIVTGERGGLCSVARGQRQPLPISSRLGSFTRPRQYAWMVSRTWVYSW